MKFLKLQKCLLNKPLVAIAPPTVPHCARIFRPGIPRKFHEISSQIAGTSSKEKQQIAKRIIR